MASLILLSHHHHPHRHQTSLNDKPERPGGRPTGKEKERKNPTENDIAVESQLPFLGDCLRLQKLLHKRTLIHRSLFADAFPVFILFGSNGRRRRVTVFLWPTLIFKNGCCPSIVLSSIDFAVLSGDFSGYSDFVWCSSSFVSLLHFYLELSFNETGPSSFLLLLHSNLVVAVHLMHESSCKLFEDCLRGTETTCLGMKDTMHHRKRK